MILWLLEKNFEEGMNALFRGNMGMVKWPAHISREIASTASAMLAARDCAYARGMGVGYE